MTELHQIDNRIPAQAVTVSMPCPMRDPVPSHLPHIFRVQSIERYPAQDHHCLTRAVIFHEWACLTVEWQARHVDARVTIGSLVSVCWLGNPASRNGALQIDRLEALEKPEAEVNLFDLVPIGWVQDRELVKRAAVLLENQPRAFRHLFNAIFWNGQRFDRFLSGPSTLGGHHNAWNGNFRHSVEVAERALIQGQGQETIYLPILALGGLLHDAGKAEAYEYDLVERCFRLSDRGQLVGHQHTVLEWVAVARAQHQIILPEEHYLALLHALTAIKGAPEWPGMRTPRRPEARILARVSDMPDDSDLFVRHRSASRNFGTCHAHLDTRPSATGDHVFRR